MTQKLKYSIFAINLCSVYIKRDCHPRPPSRSPRRIAAETRRTPFPPRSAPSNLAGYFRLDIPSWLRVTVAEHGSSGFVPHAKSSLTRLSRLDLPQSYGIRRGAPPCLPLRYDLRDLHTREKRRIGLPEPRFVRTSRDEGIDPREGTACTWEERVVEREAVSRRFNALLEKVFELVYERLDASRGGKCVVEGKRGCEGISSIPVSPVSSPDDNRQAPPTRELSSFAMHNNLPPYIHIHKWRMHIRDKFPRGVPRLYAPKCKLFSGQIESWRGWQLRVGSRVYGGGEGRVVDRKDWYCRFQILDTPDT